MYGFEVEKQLRIQECSEGTTNLPLNKNAAATLQLQECCGVENARGTSKLVLKHSLQSAELKLVPEEGGGLRKAWGDVALVGNRTSERGTSHQFH
jgi:hypothetical protein